MGKLVNFLENNHKTPTPIENKDDDSWLIVGGSGVWCVNYWIMHPNTKPKDRDINI